MMRSNKENAQSRRRFPRMLIAAAALLAAAVFLLVMSVLQSRQTILFQSRSGFRLEGGDRVFYAQAGNGLCAATTEWMQLFSSAGKCAAKESASMADPACAGSSHLGVYYDTGRAGFHALYPDGAHRYMDTEGPVLAADVNETGLVTVLMDKSGYRGSVMVYDTDLTPLFRWDAGTVTPVTARTSEDGLLCVNCVSDAGSELRFFRIDREAEQASYALAGELILDTGFLTDGTVCAVTPNRLLFLTPAGERIADHSLDGRKLDAYLLRGSFAAVATVSVEDGASAQLTTLDSRGHILGIRDTDRAVAALSGAGEWLLVLFYGQESTLYSSTLEEEVSYQPAADVTQAFLSPDGRALFGGSQRALRIDFSR